ncbi:hypothetical protein BC938DRAFT_475221, partial [Jimgerdemannia flammicorona]
MPFSHHSHSDQFCLHAKGILEDIVLEAIRKGFKIYGLSEYMSRYAPTELYPEEVEFESFLTEAHRLQEKCRFPITLLVGTEIEYITPSCSITYTGHPCKAHGRLCGWLPAPRQRYSHRFLEVASGYNHVFEVDHAVATLFLRIPRFPFHRQNRYICAGKGHRAGHTEATH